MAAAFMSHSEHFVSKDYLDARLEALEARLGARLSLLTWMVGMGFTVLIIPQLRAWFG